MDYVGQVHNIIVKTLFVFFSVIFRWLATKNLKEMNFDRVEKGSPEEVLMGLKTGTTTYAMVFDTMCK